MQLTMNQKGFIAIPLLIAIIASVIAVSAVATGVVLYKTGKLNLGANISESIKEDTEPAQQEEEPGSQPEEIIQEEIPEDTSQTEQELEQAKLEAEKAQAEAEKAQAEAEKAQSEAERLRAEQEAEKAKREAEEAKEEVDTQSKESKQSNRIILEKEDKKEFSLRNNVEDSLIINHLQLYVHTKEGSFSFWISFPNSKDSDNRYFLGTAEASPHLTAELDISCERNYDGEFPDECERYYVGYNREAGKNVKKIMKETVNEIRPGEEARIKIEGSGTITLYSMPGSITEKSTGNNVSFGMLKL